MATAEEKILSYLQVHEEIPDSGDFAVDQRLDHSEIVNVIKSLHGFRFVDAQVHSSAPYSSLLFVTTFFSRVLIKIT